MEYRQVTHLQYERYRQVADEAVAKVSKWAQKPTKLLRYGDILSWFESTHAVRFIFYGPASSEVCPIGLVSNPVVKETDDVFNYACAGMSIAAGGRYVIAVNQASSRPRMIFTLLHEVAHILCHLGSDISVAAFLPTGQYSSEQQPLEDEANIVASLLFAPDTFCQSALRDKMSFIDMQSQTGMSALALYNRLRNYLYYTLRASNSFTYSFLQCYKDGAVPLHLWAHVQELEDIERMRKHRGK